MVVEQLFLVNNYESKSGLKCLTVILKFDIDTELNLMLTSVEATNRFDQDTSHLTLSYDYDESIDELPLIPFELNYDNLVVKPLDINFIPPTSKERRMTTASCGHVIIDEESVTCALAHYDRMNERCIHYSSLCKRCYSEAVDNDEVLRTVNEEDAWLTGHDSWR